MCFAAGALKEQAGGVASGHKLGIAGLKSRGTTRKIFGVFRDFFFSNHS
jgi:hypothetical protein